jgi:hypothetical protein
MTNKELHFPIANVVSTARKRFENDSMNLVHLLPEFVELLSAYVCNAIVKANEKGKSEWVFVNFWKVHWRSEEDEPAFMDMRASFNSTSAARKLTQRFIENGEKVDGELEQYFQYIISRGGQHVTLLEDLSLMAQTSGDLYPKEMKLGKNIGYLFRALFTSILILTFEKNGRVSIPGIGAFDRHFKIKKKKNANETKGGVLQFHPELSIM